MKKVDVCIGTDRARNIRVRLSLIYCDDGTGEVISEKFHSFNLSPIDDPVVVSAAVEAHLAQPQAVSGIPGAPWPKIPDAEWQEVLDCVKIMHTPERIAEYQAMQAKALEKL